MMHRAWSSIEEVPYCFWRSSVKFQGHIALKIVEFDPNRAFPDCNSSLNSPMAMKCCTKLKTAKKRCPIVFQGHPSNFKVTRDKTSLILTQIGHFRTIGRSPLSNPSDLPCFQVKTLFELFEEILPSSIQYKTHLCGQLSCWSIRYSWSIACRRCSNYIFILHSTPGFNMLHKDNCKPIREAFEVWDLVQLILEILQYCEIWRGQCIDMNPCCDIFLSSGGLLHPGHSEQLWEHLTDLPQSWSQWVIF